jgi:hypothetical protein
VFPTENKRIEDYLRGVCIVSIKNYTAKSLLSFNRGAFNLAQKPVERDLVLLLALGAHKHACLRVVAADDPVDVLDGLAAGALELSWSHAPFQVFPARIILSLNRASWAFT